MKLPNGYGSVIKLSGKRRKPYAVRISIGAEQKNSECCNQKLKDSWSFCPFCGKPIEKELKFRQKYKYLEYFATQKEAHAYLAKYNTGDALPEHEKLTDLPTFTDVYNLWLDYRKKSTSPPSEHTVKNYNIAYRHFSELHNQKFKNIRLAELQNVFDQYRAKAKSTVVTMGVVAHGMWEYGMRYELVSRDYSKLVDIQWTDTTEPAHKVWDKQDIKKVWELNEKIPRTDYILILLYTGMRASEFLNIENANIHLDEHYMTGGLKTQAGKDRIIPIHDKIYPIIKKYYNPDNKYLIVPERANHYTYGNFREKVWDRIMKEIGFDYTCHDCRHTFATACKLNNVDQLCTKLILGHAIDDLTERVYTKIPVSKLYEEINKVVL